MIGNDTGDRIDRGDITDGAVRARRRRRLAESRNVGRDHGAAGKASITGNPIPRPRSEPTPPPRDDRAPRVVPRQSANLGEERGDSEVCDETFVFGRPAADLHEPEVWNSIPGAKTLSKTSSLLSRDVAADVKEEWGFEHDRQFDRWPDWRGIRPRHRKERRPIVPRRRSRDPEVGGRRTVLWNTIAAR